MDEWELLQRSIEAKKKFGANSTKYSGSVTVELFKQAFDVEGIRTSPRDVFIRGVPIEIDLLIPRQNVAPLYGVLYEPKDVFVVLEVKNRGVFGENALKRIHNNFLRIVESNAEIYCAYVTLVEQEGYKWAATERNLGFPVYTLFWQSGTGKNAKYNAMGAWRELVSDIKKILADR